MKVRRHFHNPGCAWKLKVSVVQRSPTRAITVEERDFLHTVAIESIRREAKKSNPIGVDLAELCRPNAPCVAMRQDQDHHPVGTCCAEVFSPKTASLDLIFCSDRPLALGYMNQDNPPFIQKAVDTPVR